MTETGILKTNIHEGVLITAFMITELTLLVLPGTAPSYPTGQRRPEAGNEGGIGPGPLGKRAAEDSKGCPWQWEFCFCFLKIE